MINDMIKRLLEEAAPGTAPEVFVPEHASQGHYSTNLALRLAKTLGKQPMEVAHELKQKVAAATPEGFFEKIEVAPPGFLNFWIAPAALQEEFSRMHGSLETWGKSDMGGGKTIIVEYSAPNIAKKMHLGHLRTTIIGDALANILAFLNYRVIRWNYIGDWGTQFGKLIAAYKLWGDKTAVEQHPLDELQKLYVRFHDEIKRDPTLEARGQEEFKKLEEGDALNRALWEWFRAESLQEFEKTYALLGITFDTNLGESFYEKDLRPLVEKLIADGVARKSEGAIVIPLDGAGLPPALIRKGDGASLYLTRDIANIAYRLNTYHPEKILYVVGNEQSLHFAQLFAVAHILKLDQAELVHVKYGLVLGEGSKKLATREGRTVLLEDILEKAVSLARAVAEKKNSDLSPSERDLIAQAIGIGALKYNDLKENRRSDIVFDWDRMLDLTGDSAPYLQYTYARLRSILRKVGAEPIKEFGAGSLRSEIELTLIRKLLEFPDEVRRSGEVLSTSNLAKYLYELAGIANRFYETTPMLQEEDISRRAALLTLAESVAAILSNGLALFGIKTPEII